LRWFAGDACPSASRLRNRRFNPETNIQENGEIMGSESATTLFENVLYTTKNSIAYITLNRPKVLNALSRKTIEELKAAFTLAQSDHAVRGVILTGSGDRAFIAGADIAELSEVTKEQALEFAQNGQACLSFIETLGKPVIAAVNGFALGGGCETAMACTIRIASEQAKFGQPEVKLGIIPGYGGTQRLPRLVGKGHALQLILLGSVIDAQEAHRIGLVNEVVPASELITRAEAILNQIASNAPLAVQYAMDAVHKGADRDLADALKTEAELFSLAADTEDKREGTRAFVERRPPCFKGI
jgi:enoyl-CoA hydratase